MPMNARLENNFEDMILQHEAGKVN